MYIDPESIFEEKWRLDTETYIFIYYNGPPRRGVSAYFSIRNNFMQLIIKCFLLNYGLRPSIRRLLKPKTHEGKDYWINQIKHFFIDTSIKTLRDVEEEAMRESDRYDDSLDRFETTRSRVAEIMLEGICDTSAIGDFKTACKYLKKLVSPSGDPLYKPKERFFNSSIRPVLSGAYGANDDEEKGGSAVTIQSTEVFDRASKIQFDLRAFLSDLIEKENFSVFYGTDAEDTRDKLIQHLSQLDGTLRIAREAKTKDRIMRTISSDEKYRKAIHSLTEATNQAWVFLKTLHNGLKIKAEELPQKISNGDVKITGETKAEQKSNHQKVLATIKEIGEIGGAIMGAAWQTLGPPIVEILKRIIKPPGA